MKQELQRGFFRRGFWWTLLLLAAALALPGCQDTPPPGERAPSPTRQATAAADENNAQGDDPHRLGEEVFNRMCAVCHGARGSGRGTRPGPSLQRTDYVYGRDYEEVKASIRDGRPGGMPFFHHALSDEELEAVTQYVLSLGR
ncbi:c-type cytochrome [Geoalkalibacter halelectricus]|uniref:c-type cytochrome n=1 Tax=Geoalkalibacter halelectricus TaxID=2847045 RepID=UPI003D1EED2B